MKNILMDINLGIGDYIFLRVFMDGIKHQYDSIAITLSKAGMQFWHNNDPKRWEFNIELCKLLFSEPPYNFVITTLYWPFFPNERIVRELNDKPVKPNLDCLCVGKSLDINNYIVITTKMRQFPKVSFEQIKEKLTLSLQKLSKNHTIAIIGEREVQKSREYQAECNREQVFGIYEYLTDILPEDKIIDLTIPELGITCSTLSQFQQDCLIMKEADAVITFGIGGNLWMSTGVAKQTISFRADSEWTTDLMSSYPNMFITKDIDGFVDYLDNL